MGTSEIEARLIKCIDEAMIRVEGVAGAVKNCLEISRTTPSEWFDLGVTLMAYVDELKDRVRYTRALRNSICADMNERNRSKEGRAE